MQLKPFNNKVFNIYIVFLCCLNLFLKDCVVQLREFGLQHKVTEPVGLQVFSCDCRDLEA